MTANEVEAVARAMYAARYSDPFDKQSAEGREEFMDMARAALEAIPRTHVMTIECPCGAEVDVPLNPSIDDDEDGTQRIVIDPDMADLWAHNFTHDGDIA